MSTEADDTILTYARQQELTIVTLDSDFHALIALSGSITPSVVRLRVEGLKAQQACDLIVRVLLNLESELERGVLVSTTLELIRVKRLPITRL